MLSQINFIEQVSTKTPYTHTDSVFDFASFSFAKPQSLKAKIIAIDFGAKANILNELTSVGLEVEVMPHTFRADEIVARFQKGEIQGVFLSNGPGDPLVLCNEVEQIKMLHRSKYPQFLVFRLRTSAFIYCTRLSYA